MNFLGNILVSFYSKRCLIVNKHALIYKKNSFFENDKKLKKEDFLDEVMRSIYEDTGSVPYNAEDVCCDFIRWVENYMRPGAHYSHVDMDNVWSSSKIKNHPFGRQKAMLELGLVDTFNTRKHHPSDDTVLKEVGMSIEEYKEKCKTLH